MEDWRLRLDHDGRLLGEWTLSGGPVTLCLVEASTLREVLVLSWAVGGTQAVVPASDVVTRILPVSGASESPTVERNPEASGDATTAPSQRLEEAVTRPSPVASALVDEEDDLTLPLPEDPVNPDEDAASRE